MKKITKYISLLFITIYMVGCQTTQLEILENPNRLKPSQSSPDLLLNNIQINFASFFESVTEEGMEVTRILHMFGPDYYTAYGPGQFNGSWTNAYANIISDTNTLFNVTEGQSGFEVHKAMSQIMKAYVIMTLVDYFGDVPYTEIDLGASNYNPTPTPGADVYAAAEALLVSAKTNLTANPDYFKPQDLYYGNGDLEPNITRWTKLANTLLLKLYLQSSLLDPAAATLKINTILGEGVIDNQSDDFEFRYSTTDQNPNSRHPIFARNYDSRATDYMNNYFMNLLLDGKTQPDPRIRYYFYRQTDDASAGTTSQLPCLLQSKPSHYSANTPYCYLPNGYWGRDHGNAGGIPPDNGLRTTWGLYPVGGLFDNDTYVTVNSRDLGAKGAGISPIMLTSFVKFMQAEAALTLGTAGDPLQLMKEGIQASFNKVLGFMPSSQDSRFVPTSVQTQNYINEVTTEYNAATSNDDKLEIIVREYFIALFGNGVEAYNTYRRTGKPENLQPTLSASPGVFIRSFFYPSDAVNNNSNLNQKANQTIPVFWDTRAENFVD